MSWMQKLYETYDLCREEVGKMPAGGKAPLLPVYHATQQAQIEAVIDMEGNWCPGRGRVITDKADMITIIPVTEESASRSGKDPAAHPLFDKLEYLAGDFEAYSGGQTGRYPTYMKGLEAWCSSPQTHPRIKAVERYLKKGCLMRDLETDGLLFCDTDGKVPEKWPGDKEEVPPIYRVCTAGPLKAFVRFRVLSMDGQEERLWLDPSVWESWIAYQNAQEAEQDICYVTGEKKGISRLSPRNIRRPGDGAKLVSSNDGSGFTYRGRFADAAQALSLGRETTEKAHSALRWLISRQAYFNGEQVILAWNVHRKQPPAGLVGADALDLSLSLAPNKAIVTTGENFAREFRKALRGYNADLTGGEQAAVIGLDAATPGRLSVFYYRETNAADLLERVAYWHSSCSWLHTYRTVEEGVDAKNKPNRVRRPFVGAPAPKDIIEAAYGRNADDSLKKNATQRLLPCIVEGAGLPKDLMLCAARRAINTVSLEDWEISKYQSIACALIRKYYNDEAKKKTGTDEEVWKMELDESKRERSYLFGRVLAYVRRLEELSQWASGNDPRQTNAERMQVAFYEHPYRTWVPLYNQLVTSYLPRLRTYGKGYGDCRRYEEELTGIMKTIDENGWFTDQPLNPTFLLGYQVQIHQFYQDIKARKEKGQPVDGPEEETEE